MRNRNNNDKRNQPMYLVNTRIPFKTLRVVRANGEQVGVISKAQALDIARESKLDLVIIAEKADPPVAKIIDFDKFKYEQQKAKKESEKKSRQSRVETKEVQFRPGIHEHDIAVKAKQIGKFLEKGNKVKVIVKFFGRERSHRDQAQPLIDVIFSKLGEGVKFDKNPDYQGQHVWFVLTK
jgi:translation initiation factor IF-3